MEESTDIRDEERFMSTEKCEENIPRCSPNHRPDATEFPPVIGTSPNLVRPQSVIVSRIEGK